MTGDLLQCHLMHRTFPERGARLGIDTQNGLRQEVINGLPCLGLRKNHLYAPFKVNARKGANERFVVFLIDYFLHFGLQRYELKLIISMGN